MREQKVQSKKIVNTTKEGKKKRNKSSNNGFYYSFLTIVLLLCLIQITISAVCNISKIVSYKTKIIQITKTRDLAKARNEQLQDSIRNFSNISGLEEIARNNLKMSSEDEVLVIINAKPEDAKKEEKDNITKLIKLKKHD